jgi:hypothetical protein
MTKYEKIWLSIAIFVVLIGATTGAISYFFGVAVISSGEAYGFHVGDNREKAYDDAEKLLAEKEIAAIHTWPKDEYHRPFELNENPKQNNDPRWVMVVNPDWWNNTVTVTFKNDVVTEIRRDRIYCELP